MYRSLYIPYNMRQATIPALWRQPELHTLPHWLIPSVPSDSTGTTYSGQAALINRHYTETTTAVCDISNATVVVAVLRCRCTPSLVDTSQPPYDPIISAFLCWAQITWIHSRVRYRFLYSACNTERG